MDIKAFICQVVKLSAKCIALINFLLRVCLFVFNVMPASVDIFMVIKIYGLIISGFYNLFSLKTVKLYLA